MRSSRRTFVLLLAAYIIYAAAFVYRTSFIIGGLRYFSLFDDEMVSMRYAYNLAHGNGLIFNPGGARVEGFTNPLWVLYMAVLHLLPVARAKMSLLVQISGLALLALNLLIVKRLAELLSDGSEAVALCAVTLTAFYLPLNNWGLQGTEVSAVALIVSAEALIAVRGLGGAHRYGVLYMLAGLATLLRPDMVVPSVIIVGFLAAADPPRRKRHLLLGLGSVVLFLLAQGLFALYYYGNMLPNTYYLKLTGYPLLPRVSRGLLVTVKFLLEMNPLLPILAIGLILVRRDRRLLLLGSLFCGQLAYSAFVGGDAWEWWGGSNRYVSLAMPLFFVLLAEALAPCARYAFSAVGRRVPAFQRFGVSGTLAAFTLIALMSLNLPVGQRSSLLNEPVLQFNRYPYEGFLLINRPLEVPMNEADVRQALLVREITDRRATIQVGAAGAIPYFARRRAIDLAGKNDRRIAREASRLLPGDTIWTSFFPGHIKWDYAHSIGDEKPDLIVQLGFSPAGAGKFLNGEYRVLTIGGAHGTSHGITWYKPYGTWWARADSKHVHVDGQPLFLP